MKKITTTLIFVSLLGCNNFWFNSEGGTDVINCHLNPSSSDCDDIDDDPNAIPVAHQQCVLNIGKKNGNKIDGSCDAKFCRTINSQGLVECSGSEYCSNGNCISCPAGNVACKYEYNSITPTTDPTKPHMNVCVDLKISQLDCGSCGNKCSPNNRCTDGKCVPKFNIPVPTPVPTPVKPATACKYCNTYVAKLQNNDFCDSPNFCYQSHYYDSCDNCPDQWADIDCKVKGTTFKRSTCVSSGGIKATHKVDYQKWGCVCWTQAGTCDSCSNSIYCVDNRTGTCPL